MISVLLLAALPHNFMHKYLKSSFSDVVLSDPEPRLVEGGISLQRN